MEASKRMMTPTPFQRIEQLTRENTALREEMARFHKLQSANAYFIKETKECIDRLQQAVFEWRKAQKDIDNDFKKENSVYSVDTGSIKVGISGSQ
jgi:phage host-nuclease inhibitor protein Gam